MAGLKKHPLRVVKIQVFQGGVKNREALSDEVTQVIKKKYGDVLEKDDAIELSIGEVLCQFRMEHLPNFFVLKSTIRYRHDYDLAKVLDDDLKYFDLASSLPSFNLLSSLVILLPMTKDELVATTLVERYSSHLSRPRIGIGLVRGCLFSILGSEKEEEDLFNRYYFLSPLYLQEEVCEKRIEEILSDIRELVVQIAELSEICNDSKRFFITLEPGEREVKERTEEFLWEVMYSPKAHELSAGLESLEAWLSYMTQRKSALSAMIADMRLKYMKVKSIVSKLENLFKKMDEKSFEDYPKNSETEIETYKEALRPFENYLARSEILRARLDNVMETIRMYLSLQQQKITIEEQKSSKEQLVRLVNLQEIFHKVEIFIVAVYITEMAKVVFEVLAHERANLLAAMFIPAALLLAVGVSRLLHRETE